MSHQEYTDLFLLGDLVPLVGDTSAIAPELLEKLGRFRDFEALTAEDQLHHLEPPRVYWRVKVSKDGPYDTEKTHPDLHG